MKGSFLNRKWLRIVFNYTQNSDRLAFVMHGHSWKKEQAHILWMEKNLLDSGFSVVNFDSTCSFWESEWDYIDSSMTQHNSDLEDSIDYITKNIHKTDKYFLAWHSLWGHSVTYMAEKYPENLYWIFANAPLVSWKFSFESTEMFFPWELEKWKKDWFKKSISLSWNVKISPWDYMEDKLNHDLIPEAYKIKCPVLILCGSEDTSCPYYTQEALFNAIKIEEKELHLVDWAPHTFKNEEHLKKQSEIFNNFLKKYF